ncbi:hypothetical protein [Rhizobium lentis]|uniref:hypothetical protein n=1 Tax=Rhizobium lentis TaxID=1138194 RepID=UPI001C83CDDB|nr:hypothetical protein [Rhizobium lentis]MBX5008151.1 hypothetical protein [Rhizobium lentis]
MTKLSFNTDETPTPESKADIVAEMIRFMALRMEPVGFGAILARLMEVFDAPEEDIGSEVQRAYFTLLRAGLLTSNDYDPVNSAAVIRVCTVAQPSKSLTDFIWDEPEWSEDSELFND